MLEEIKSYLETKDITNVFIGSMPTSPDICTVLYATGGYNPYIGFNNIVEYPTFQVMCRGINYLEVSSRIENIKNFLNGNTLSFPFIENIQPPVGLGRDNSNRWEFSCNFKITREV
jgi:hypothetical protein